MLSPNRPDLIRAQVQASRLRGAKNRFIKDRNDDNANALLDELSSARGLISGRTYEETSRLLVQTSHLYGTDLMTASSQILKTAATVELELVEIANHLDETLNLDGRL